MSIYELHEERQRRAAKNQSLFREVNERIEKLGTQATYIEFACECADDRCQEPVSMTIEEYEAIRRIPTHFAMNPEHDVPGMEHVVEKVDPRYWVVEKFGAGEIVALKLDPRARHSKDARPGAPSISVAHLL